MHEAAVKLYSIHKMFIVFRCRQIVVSRLSLTLLFCPMFVLR